MFVSFDSCIISPGSISTKIICSPAFPVVFHVTFTVAVSEDGVPLSKLTSKTYDITVRSSDILKRNTLQAGFTKSDCSGTINDFTTTDNQIFTGHLTIPNQNICDDIGFTNYNESS